MDAAFTFIKDRFKYMQRYGIQYLWFTLDESYGYPLWSLLNISEEGWSLLSDITGLNSKIQTKQKIKLFAKLDFELKMTKVQLETDDGNRVRVYYFRVCKSIVSKDWPEVADSQMKNPRNVDEMSEVFEQFCKGGNPVNGGYTTR